MSQSNNSDYAEEIFDNRYQISIYNSAKEILKDYDENTPMSVSELMEKISDYLGEKQKDSVVYKTLLCASKSSLSRIKSRKGKGGGYFLISESELSSVSETEDIPTKSDIKREKTLEKHIWPLVSLWFQEEKGIKNASHDIANLKLGGVWSNPDVVAIAPIDDLGLFDIEIHTAEVKPSLSQWRYYFFEAVSHKRFSERSYFIFRSTPGENEHRNELMQYAEKYGVGVVEIELNDDEFDKLPRWNSLEGSEQIQFLDYIVERVPAAFEPISIREKIEFLKRLKINNKKDIYEFGIF